MKDTKELTADKAPSARSPDAPFGDDPLLWMVEVADAQDRGRTPGTRTISLKFSRATLQMWIERARAEIARPKGEIERRDAVWREALGKLDAEECGPPCWGPDGGCICDDAAPLRALVRATGREAT